MTDEEYEQEELEGMPPGHEKVKVMLSGSDKWILPKGEVKKITQRQEYKTDSYVRLAVDAVVVGGGDVRTKDGSIADLKFRVVSISEME